METFKERLCLTLVLRNEENAEKPRNYTSKLKRKLAEARLPKVSTFHLVQLMAWWETEYSFRQN